MTSQQRKTRKKEKTTQPSSAIGTAGLKPIGPIAPSWAPRPILQTLVQGDCEPGPTKIVPNWAPHLLRPALAIGYQTKVFILQAK